MHDLSPVLRAEDAQRRFEHHIGILGSLCAQSAGERVVQREVRLLLLPVLPRPRKVAA